MFNRTLLIAVSLSALWASAQARSATGAIFAAVEAGFVGGISQETSSLPPLGKQSHQRLPAAEADQAFPTDPVSSTSQTSGGTSGLAATAVIQNSMVSVLRPTSVGSRLIHDLCSALPEPSPRGLLRPPRSSLAV